MIISQDNVLTTKVNSKPDNLQKHKQTILMVKQNLTVH